MVIVVIDHFFALFAPLEAYPKLWNAIRYSRSRLQHTAKNVNSTPSTTVTRCVRADISRTDRWPGRRSDTEIQQPKPRPSNLCLPMPKSDAQWINVILLLWTRRCQWGVSKLDENPECLSWMPDSLALGTLSFYEIMGMNLLSSCPTCHKEEWHEKMTMHADEVEAQSWCLWWCLRGPENKHSSMETAESCEGTKDQTEWVSNQQEQFLLHLSWPLHTLLVSRLPHACVILLLVPVAFSASMPLDDNSVSSWSQVVVPAALVSTSRISVVKCGPLFLCCSANRSYVFFALSLNVFHKRLASASLNVSTLPSAWSSRRLLFLNTWYEVIQAFCFDVLVMILDPLSDRIFLCWSIPFLSHNWIDLFVTFQAVDSSTVLSLILFMERRRASSLFFSSTDRCLDDGCLPPASVTRNHPFWLILLRRRK